jgi:hypothetical protein
MSSPETAVLLAVVVRVLERRARSGADAAAVAAAIRRAYDELAGVLAPLIGQVGVDALVARALHLTRRDYPSDQAADEQAAEQFAQVSLWLEQKDPTLATDAAAAMLARFAALLTTLIGEPLTTRYLRKAWPDAFSDTGSEGIRA